MLPSPESQSEPTTSRSLSEPGAIELSHQDTQALIGALAARISNDVVRAASRSGELREGYPVTISPRSFWRAMAPYISMN